MPLTEDSRFCDSLLEMYSKPLGRLLNRDPFAKSILEEREMQKGKALHLSKQKDAINVDSLSALTKKSYNDYSMLVDQQRKMKEA